MITKRRLPERPFRHPQREVHASVSVSAASGECSIDIPVMAQTTVDAGDVVEVVGNQAGSGNSRQTFGLYRPSHQSD